MNGEHKGQHNQALEDKQAAEKEAAISYVRTVESADSFMNRLDDLIDEPHVPHRTVSPRAIPLVIQSVFPAFKHAS